MAAPRTLVLGIGNILWADEGFGVRAVEAFHRLYAMADGVELLDGGTQGLYLVDRVCDADRLVVFDAIDYGLAPGTLHQVENEEVPRFLGAKKMSLHQTGFQEVLMLAQLTEQYPEQVLLVGCQPQELEDYGGSLRPRTLQALEEALPLALEHLQQWGACPVPRSRPLEPAQATTAAHLRLNAYEAGRPSAEEACRIGDARFIPR